MTDAEAEQYLEKVTEDLGEHFEAVQILVSGNVDGKTYLIKRGAGNWWARQGMAHEFINSEVNEDNAQRIANIITPPEGDNFS